jgi:hypothetical protein
MIYIDERVWTVFPAFAGTFSSRSHVVSGFVGSLSDLAASFFDGGLGTFSRLSDRVAGSFVAGALILGAGAASRGARQENADAG